MIVRTYGVCDGDWAKLGRETGVSEQNVQYWKEYAAQFLGNLGNFKVRNPLPRCSWEPIVIVGTVFRRPEVRSSDP